MDTCILGGGVTGDNVYQILSPDNWFNLNELEDSCEKHCFIPITEWIYNKKCVVSATKTGAEVCVDVYGYDDTNAIMRE